MLPYSRFNISQIIIKSIFNRHLFFKCKTLSRYAFGMSKCVVVVSVGRRCWSEVACEAASAAACRVSVLLLRPCWWHWLYRYRVSGSAAALTGRVSVGIALPRPTQFVTAASPRIARTLPSADGHRWTHPRGISGTVNRCGVNAKCIPGESTVRRMWRKLV